MYQIAPAKNPSASEAPSADFDATGCPSAAAQSTLDLTLIDTQAGRWILGRGHLVHDTTTTMPGPCSEKSAPPREGRGHSGCRAAGVPSWGPHGPGGVRSPYPISLAWQVTRVSHYVRQPLPSKETRRIPERDDPGPPVYSPAGFRFQFPRCSFTFPHRKSFHQESFSCAYVAKFIAKFCIERTINIEPVFLWVGTPVFMCVGLKCTCVLVSTL